MSEQKSDYAVQLEYLKESGAIDRVAEMIRSEADVWIKRSSGAWERGKAYELGHGGLSTGVKWHDEERGRQLWKNIPTTDFLKWQEEDHGEGTQS